MRYWATLLCCFLSSISLKSFAVQATCSSYIFYKKSNKDSAHLEANIVLSWRAQNKSIHFKKNDQGEYFALLNCLVRISNDSAILKEEEFIVKTPAKKNPEDLAGLLIADQYTFAVPQDKDLTIEFVLYEKEYNTELFQYKNEHKLSKRLTSTNILSDIVLLDTFFSANINTPFSRGSYVDIPNCANFLNEHKDSAHFILEIYPHFLPPNNAVKKIITLQCNLSYKKNDAPIPNKTTEDTLIFDHQPVVPIRKAFACKDLKSGNYYLNVRCIANDQEVGSQNLFFQIYNPNYSPSKPTTKKEITSVEIDSTNKKESHILDLTNTFVGKYDAAQVRAILKMLLLICDPTEAISINGFLNKPDELYSKYFIYNFWEKRDKLNPTKAWLEYAEKIKEVNKLFRGSGLSGYESDRGRVYIQYGKPNDRIIVNNETGALPYEIWQYYNTEKQGMEGVFLFYKPGRALGDYQLLHSTLRGERRNASWRSLLYNNSITGGGNINNNSQAEQYIGNK